MDCEYSSEQDRKENLLVYLDESDTKCQHIAYGTAGFREKADLIEPILCKVGLFAGVYCMMSKANVGVMITASHNPEQDNGVKIISRDGSMMEFELEPVIERLSNIQSKQDFVNEIMSLIKLYKIDLSRYHFHTVLLGMDTRPSSLRLSKFLVKGIAFWPIQVRSYSYLTTPALHYLVATSNSKKELLELEDYYEKLANGFVDSYTSNKKELSFYDPSNLVVDCANGVGYLSLKNLLDNISFAKLLPLTPVNTGDGILNLECGADFVKTTKKPPKSVDILEGKRYASLDGDADRIVYFYFKGGDLKLLDGDKIAVLFTKYIKHLCLDAKLIDKLKLGCIQTAYANGASTEYLKKELLVTVECAATGVKNLHHKALSYDIAIYFEANGHGTIFLSKLATKLFQESSRDLQSLLKILNNTTGDAVSDLLIVETILRHFDWDIQKWDSLYKDRPYTMCKVENVDKGRIKTEDVDRICVEPQELGLFIQAEIARCGESSRCFVRPSGTENIVRVYAEAVTQELSDSLAKKVSMKVYEMLKL